MSSRKVGTPLSAEIPAPLSTVIRTITKLAGLLDTGHVAELGDWVRVDPQAAKPLFDQFGRRSSTVIRDGKLPPGTRLPTVRELAGQLGLAVNTVARAYRELEAAGILETRGRFGTFVARVDPADAAMADGGAHLCVDGACDGGGQGRRRCATSRRRSAEKR